MQTSSYFDLVPASKAISQVVLACNIKDSLKLLSQCRCSFVRSVSSHFSAIIYSFLCQKAKWISNKMNVHTTTILIQAQALIGASNHSTILTLLQFLCLCFSFILFLWIIIYNLFKASITYFLLKINRTLFPTLPDKICNAVTHSSTSTSILMIKLCKSTLRKSSIIFILSSRIRFNSSKSFLSWALATCFTDSNVNVPGITKPLSSTKALFICSSVKSNVIVLPSCSWH